MKKKYFIIGAVVFVVLGMLLVIYPTIEIQTEDQFIAFRYSDDITEFESQVSLDECYTYYEKRNISLHSFDFKKFLFFHVIVMDYIEGNYCDTEFLLEESYIEAFLERAEIEYNSHNLDIAQLIEGKEAIVGNTRYFGNEFDREIGYVLDGIHETLFVFNVDDLLVIQVGMSDEGPKYIAYK